MRHEIKFRAWDKMTKCMYQVRCLEFLADRSLFDIRLVVPVQINEDDIDFDFPIRRPGEYELMQYTGLKDKNGKEIFEGDIVKHGDKIPTGVFEYIHTVVYATDRAQFYLANPNRPQFNECAITIKNIIGKGKIFEVIGNIYENPELL